MKGAVLERGRSPRSALSRFRSERLKTYVSELVGTYVLVVAGPGSVVLLPLASISGPEALGIVALTFGGCVALVIIFLGKVSGAIINPAITLAVAFARLLKRGSVIPYLLFQMVGGVLAGLTLRLIFGTFGDSTNLGSPKLAIGVTPAAGVALEAAGTFILASSALVAAVRIKNARHQALFVGGTLTILILLIGPFTGAGFNPARSLGPSVASGYFSSFYVYIIGPIAGGLFAGLLFRRFVVRHYP